MIELTAQQAEALEHADATPPRVVHPRTRETFVLLRMDEYESLADDVTQVLGTLSPTMRQQLDDCLKSALGLP